MKLNCRVLQQSKSRSVQLATKVQFHPPTHTYKTTHIKQFYLPGNRSLMIEIILNNKGTLHSYRLPVGKPIYLRYRTVND